MNGIYGFNVTDHAMSRDNIVAHVRDIAGGWVLVRNSPELARLCAVDLGLNVIFRVTGDDEWDRPLDRDPREFALERARLVDGLPRIWLHAVNEIGVSQRQNNWTLQFMTACEDLNRRAVIFNYSTHRSASEWKLSQTVIEQAVRRGHAVGLHVYVNETGQDTGAYYWQPLQSALGGLWIVTEFAYIKDVTDPYRGWRGTISETQYATFLLRQGRDYAQRKMPLLLFSYEHWPTDPERRDTGFGVFDSSKVLEAVALINTSQKWSMPVTQPTHQWGTSSQQRVAGFASPTTRYVNIRSLPDEKSADIGDLILEDVATVFANPLTAGRYTWQKIVKDGQVGYVASELVRWEPVVAPPEVGPVYTVGLTSDEVQNLIDYHNRSAESHLAMAENFRLIRDIYAGIKNRMTGA